MHENTTSASKHIALFGGTFCPIHNGHLGVALFLQDYFHFDAFYFLPNKAPTLDKVATASLEQRLAMLEIALAPYPFFTVDRREVNRATPSFTIDTLKDLRSELGEDAAVSLIIGMDSFKQLHRWHDWQNIFKLCNLIVMERPGEENLAFTKPLKNLLASGHIHQITEPKTLCSKKRSGFYFCNAGEYPISSTMICRLIQSGRDASTFLPPAVLEYIQEKNLFR